MNMSLALEHKTERQKVDMKEVFRSKENHTHHYNTRSKAMQRQINYNAGNEKNVEFNDNTYESTNKNKIIKCDKKHKHHNGNNHHEHNNENKHEFDHNKVLKFDRTFQLYLDDIESITGRRLLDLQRKEIQKAIENNEYRRLSTSESQENRKKFGHDKKQMIADWEEHTGEKWTTYNEPLCSNNGKIVRQAGDRYDAHEVILNSWGSPHTWFNIHPARFMSEHQNQIHRKGGYCDQIFG